MLHIILTTSQFPSMWKHAKIIHLPKPDGKYRRIAVLPYLSKVFERLVHEQTFVRQFITNQQIVWFQTSKQLRCVFSGCCRGVEARSWFHFWYF